MARFYVGGRIKKSRRTYLIITTPPKDEETILYQIIWNSDWKK
jgi:hypothetical protein